MQRANYILTSLKQPLLILALLVVCYGTVATQAVAGWEKQYESGSFTTVHDCIQTANEGFLLVGENPSGDAYITRTDADGNVRWGNSYDLAIDQTFAFHAVAKVNDGYVAVGYSLNFGMGGKRDVFIVKINENGDTLWTKDYGDNHDDEALDVVATADGGLAVVGYTEQGINTAEPTEVYLLKLNANGDTLWTKRYGNDYNDRGLAIIEADNGDLVVTGFTELNTSVPKALFLRTNSLGEQILFDDIQGGDVGTDIIKGLDDGYVISGYTINEDAVMIKVSDTGVYEGGTSFGGEFGDEFHSVTYSSDKTGYIFAGLNEVSSSDIQAYLVKTDLNGFTDQGGWEKEFGKSEAFKNETFLAIVGTSDGGYFTAGASSDAFSGIQSLYLVKTNSKGNIFTNYIKGNVFFDADFSNDLSPGDQDIEGWIVEAISDEHTCYGTSLADGSYTILVDTGVYDIQVRRPNEYWLAQPVTRIIPTPDDTLELNFAIQQLEECADLEIDISTAALTPGGESRYVLSVCNDGTDTAVDPYIDVTVDDAFTIIGASPGWSVLPNGIFRFDQDIPDLAPFECMEITIDAKLDADLVVGETHSMRAHAYPEGICNGGGDGSHLEVRTVCESDSVKLIIENTGIQAMSTSSNYIIVEDHVMFRVPMDPLGPGDEKIIPKAANGSTYRIIAEQTPGHPGDSRPTEAIEGCVASGGSFSTGFVNLFPEDDYDHFLSVDCQENVGTIIPNETRGYPKNFDSESENEILQGIDLKYIHRFQNTGPDTAIRVVIQDTLSPFLDPASVRPGASSHDYTMEVYGCGILKFTFDNIFLPNSSTDPEGSRVFVKYRVSQKPDNAIGAKLDNSAAIYFDFKAPIKTDSIYHIIGGYEYEDFVMVSTSEIFLPGINDVKFYPNPFRTEATVEIIGDVTLDHPEFILYDLTGRIVRKEAFQGMSFPFYRNNLTTGMYVYKIEDQGQPVSSGKIIIQ